MSEPLTAEEIEGTRVPVSKTSYLLLTVVGIILLLFGGLACALYVVNAQKATIAAPIIGGFLLLLGGTFAVMNAPLIFGSACYVVSDRALFFVRGNQVLGQVPFENVERLKKIEVASYFTMIGLELRDIDGPGTFWPGGLKGYQNNDEAFGVHITFGNDAKMPKEQFHSMIRERIQQLR